MKDLRTTGRIALLAAVSGLAMASVAAAQDSIRFWTTEEQPERLERQEMMAAAFTDETGIAVEVIPVRGNFHLPHPQLQYFAFQGRAEVDGSL